MLNPAITALKSKYRITARLYDLLDLPWELSFYRRMRPALLEGLSGRVFEAGVGTGRNLPYYPEHVSMTGIDLSHEMLSRSRRRSRTAKCQIDLLEADATQMPEIPSEKFDWYFSTFMYCVLPDELQPLALAEMARVLKPGARFKLVEMTYSQDPRLLRRQKFLTRFVEKIYGARFDRQTLEHIRNNPDLEITKTEFLKDDTYVLIEGKKR